MKNQMYIIILMLDPTLYTIQYIDINLRNNKKTHFQTKQLCQEKMNFSTQQNCYNCLPFFFLPIDRNIKQE